MKKDYNLTREKEYYREKIVDMIKHITDITDLELIYGMTLSAYKDTKMVENI